MAGAGGNNAGGRNYRPFNTDRPVHLTQEQMRYVPVTLEELEALRQQLGEETPDQESRRILHPVPPTHVQPMDQSSQSQESNQSLNEDTMSLHDSSSSSVQRVPSVSREMERRQRRAPNSNNSAFSDQSAEIFDGTFVLTESQEFDLIESLPTPNPGNVANDGGNESSMEVSSQSSINSGSYYGSHNVVHITPGRERDVQNLQGAQPGIGERYMETIRNVGSSSESM